MVYHSLVINADDFGQSGEINSAILSGLEMGLCSSTTIMANQPSFEEACQLAHDHHLLDRVGVHLVLTLGVPLTDAIKRMPRFCDSDGVFRFSRKRPHFLLSTDEQTAARTELNAQIERCRKAGLPITHIDSHHHCHTEFPILKIVINLAREKQIPFCRILRNCGPRIGPVRRMYKYVANRRIRKAGLAGTQFFGSIQDAAPLLKQLRHSAAVEVMVHLMFNRDRVLIDVCGLPLSELVSRLPEWQYAVSYGALGASTRVIR
jgi:chitin disaccharide deacetylase